jgi:hypothetical protein
MTTVSAVETAQNATIVATSLTMVDLPPNQPHYADDSTQFLRDFAPQPDSPQSERLNLVNQAICQTSTPSGVFRVLMPQLAREIRQFSEGYQCLAAG